MNVSTTAPAFVGFTWSAYPRLVLSALGIFTNSINIIVFVHPRLLKEITYRFMLAKSLGNFIYLMIAFMNEYFVFCVNCPITQTLFSGIYKLYIYIFAYGVFSIYRAFIEDLIVIHTFCILTNKNWTRKLPSVILILVLLILAGVYNIPKMFAYTIGKVPNREVYTLATTAFGISEANKTVSITLTSFKIFLTSAFMPFVNIVNLVLFRKRFKNRIFSTTDQSTIKSSMIYLKFSAGYKTK